LTTEDLRFADYIVRHVAEERHDVFLDGVGWEGGDEWIRAQFRVYLLCLMRTCLLEGKHFFFIAYYTVVLNASSKQRIINLSHKIINVLLKKHLVIYNVKQLL
jgi:hypothetical protein